MSLLYFCFCYLAEKFLETIEHTQNYSLLLLGLLNKEDVPLHLRVSAGITLKNFVKRNWPLVREQNFFCNFFVRILFQVYCSKCQKAVNGIFFVPVIKFVAYIFVCLCS